MNHTMASVDDRISKGQNGSWLLITGMGILLMQAGFMALEVGCVQVKHAKSCLFKTMVDQAIVAIAWFCAGYSLYSGTDNTFASGKDATWFYHSPNEFPRLFQQFGFAATACTLISGSVLSRCKLGVYLVFSGFVAGFCYPVSAHWAWSSGGFLYQMGFRDFAGGCVVHVFGGACSFVAAKACGPRVNRFGKFIPRPGNKLNGDSEASIHASENSVHDSASEDGSKHNVLSSRMSKRNSMAKESLHAILETKEPFPWRHRIVMFFACGRKPAWGFLLMDHLMGIADPGFRVRDLPGHSAPFQVLGALLLYVGWFSFNGGSSGGVSDVTLLQPAGRAVVNTMISSSSATTTAILWSSYYRGAVDLNLVVNGMLGGLVAITGSCGYIEPWVAFIVGMFAIPVYVGASNLVLYHFRVDDPMDVTAVHLACGWLGAILLGLFDFERGWFYSGNGKFFGVEVLGAVLISIWAASLAAVYFYALKYGMPRMPWVKGENGFRDEATGAGITYSVDTQLVGIDYVYFGGSGFPDFDPDAVREYNETRRIKARHEEGREKKKMLSVRMDDSSFLGTRSSNEGSYHGGKESSFHGGRTKDVSFHGVNTSATSHTSTMKSFNNRGSLVIDTGSNETTPNVTPAHSPRGSILTFFSAVPTDFGSRTGSFTEVGKGVVTTAASPTTKE